MAETEWDDIKGLSGRALRERLRTRADCYRMVASYAEGVAKEAVFDTNKSDLIRLAHKIYDMELQISQEAERLWNVYLRDQAAKVEQYIEPQNQVVS